MNSHILGGAFLPHAPQFFTKPDTEDMATVERVRALAADIGRKLSALEPDVWIMISNDHTNQFFLHCTPAFAFHVGATVGGTFAGREFSYDVDSETALGLVRYLQDEGFDPAFTSTVEMEYSSAIPLDHLGVGVPIVPLYVNAYVPPQPSMERCFALGRALARGLAAMGKTAVVIASGGMSHFPGTDRYSSPDLAFDQTLLEPLRAGQLRALLALDARRLDDTGNIELRCWGVGAGAIGERVPDVVSLDPSWHHIYGTLGWTTPPAAQDDWQPHYPTVLAERVALTAALHRLAHDGAERTRYLADPAGYAQAAGLEGAEADALVSLDGAAMAALDVHPLVPFLAKLQIDHERKQSG
jgi:2,3-dihydroxyphenylpropionate 1,2-dioxygenase